MKTRNGFVSNSSSTSFIVSPDRKQEAIDHGLELISVNELKEHVKKLKEMGTEFIFNEWYFNNILELQDNSYISQPFDRDIAYRQQIDFPAFMEDL